MRNVRQAAVPQVQLVTFKVGGEEFGLDVFAVHEILRYSEPTPVPRAPVFVEGVIDVRGTLVPVVDMRRRFELAEAPVNDETRVVLVEHGGVCNAVAAFSRIYEIAPGHHRLDGGDQLVSVAVGRDLRCGGSSGSTSRQ